jgi:hypothetical protein
VGVGNEPGPKNFDIAEIPVIHVKSVVTVTRALTTPAFEQSPETTLPEESKY